MQQNRPDFTLTASRRTGEPGGKGKEVHGPGILSTEMDTLTFPISLLNLPAFQISPEIRHPTAPVSPGEPRGGGKEEKEEEQEGSFKMKEPIQRKACQTYCQKIVYF